MLSEAKNPAIRVLVADDSAFMRTAISRMIESDPALCVADTARNGVEALEKIAALDPDVVTLDIEMPKLDGLGTLRRIMAETPRPVIMISSLTQQGAEATLEAFDIGAFECIPKQLSYASLDIVKIAGELIAKIKAAARAKQFRQPRIHSAVPPHPPPESAPLSTSIDTPPSIVAVGTSTGGPKALQEVLSTLPGDFPVGIVVVQHMPAGFTGPFARRLDGLSRISVREAADDDAIEPGVALIAPATWHMTVYRRTASKHAVKLAHVPANTLHMPSVDVLMQSVADVYGPLSMGVIMTGMGNDGEHGMKAIHDKGGITLGQDEASCVVYGMPRACAEAGILRRVAPLSRISSEMVAATRPVRKLV